MQDPNFPQGTPEVFGTRSQNLAVFLRPEVDRIGAFWVLPKPFPEGSRAFTFLRTPKEAEGVHFGGFRCTTHFRTYFSGWIGMFTGGTIWILIYGQFHVYCGCAKWRALPHSVRQKDLLAWDRSFASRFSIFSLSLAGNPGRDLPALATSKTFQLAELLFIANEHVKPSCMGSFK